MKPERAEVGGVAPDATTSRIVASDAGGSRSVPADVARLRKDRPVKAVLNGRRVLLPGEIPEDAESALPPARPVVDWLATASAAGPSDDERALFLLTRRDGLTIGEAAKELHFPQRRHHRPEP